MVEKKCMEIVDTQLRSSNEFTKEQWQALIALHSSLLNKHHGSFSASHHPVSKNRELRELATRHAMPARMWRHGIHAFLELPQHKLPDSHKQTVSLLYPYLSYPMVALIKGNAPSLLETSTQCLSDLAGYCTTIEHSDSKKPYAEQRGKEIGNPPDHFIAPKTTRQGHQTTAVVNVGTLNYMPSNYLHVLRRIIESIVPWLIAIYSCHIPMVAADPNDKGQASQLLEATSSTEEVFSLFFDWLIPLSTFGLTIASDLMIERAWLGIHPSISSSINQRAQEFWSIFTPVVTTMILPLSDHSQSWVERIIFAFILACEINQFRRCISDVVSAPIGLILMAAVWLPTQHFLTTFTIHDPAMLRVVRWLTASFTITLVAKLCGIFHRVRRRASGRNYDNTLVSGGVALMGDFYHVENHVV